MNNIFFDCKGEGGRERERDTHTHTHRDRDRDRDRQTDRQTEKAARYSQLISGVVPHQNVTRSTVQTPLF